jgi:hypothetical protein
MDNKTLSINTNLEELKLLISDLEKIIEKINSFEIKFTVKPS